MKSEILLKAGAILLSKATLPKDILSDDVVAREWIHPALQDPIVRIPTQNMLRGVDLEMGLLGFSEPVDRGVVGKRRRTKLGFPGWALVHDPDNARFALDVVKDLQKAARKIKSKPGTAKELISELGSNLATSVPHFLPSFYEEAARHFLTFENYAYAAQYFEKARESERVYALDVDPELREQTFVDFALARALSIKSLTNFGLEMIEKGKAKEGFESYFRIAIRRTRGGLPPSPAMAKDLKRLAKAAGLDPNEEERNFLADLLSAPALRMAASGFWKAYTKSLKALAKENPSARSEMLDLFPNMHPREWFKILDSCDACKALYDDSVDKASFSKHSTADWFALLLKQQNNSGWRNAKDIASRIFSLMIECKDRLVQDALKINLPEDWYGIHPDVVELGLSLGIEFNFPKNCSFVSLSDMVEYKDEEHRCVDWEYISKHKGFREMGKDAISMNARDMSSWIGLVKDRPFLMGILDEWLSDCVENMQVKAGLILSSETINTFVSYPPLLWSLFPRQAKMVMDIDLSIPLANTLQLGVLDEFGWKAYDDALERFEKPDAVILVDNFPYIILHDKSEVRVVGPTSVLLEAEIPSHKEYEIGDMIYTQDTLLLIYKKSWEEYGQWLGKTALFRIDDRLQYRGNCMRLKDGRAIFNGYRVITPGDQSFPADYNRSLNLISDGQSFWKRVSLKYKGVDPISGKELDIAPPSFLIDPPLDGTLRYVPNASSQSPIGVKDDVLGMKWTRDADGIVIGCEDIAGTTYEGSAHHFFTFPGDEESRIFNSSWRGFELSSRSGVLFANGDSHFRKGGFPNLHGAFLAYFSPRDTEASKALRRISRKRCQAFIEWAQQEKEDALPGSGILYEKLVSEFREIEDEKLRAGVWGILRFAAEQRNALDSLNKEIQAAPQAIVQSYERDPATMGKALLGILPVDKREDHVFVDQIKEIIAYFSSTEKVEGSSTILRKGTGLWEAALGHSAALAYWAALPPVLNDDENENLEKIEAIKMFVYAMVGADGKSPLIGPHLGKHIRYFEYRKKYESEKNEKYIIPPFRCGNEKDLLITQFEGNTFFTWSNWNEYVGVEYSPTGNFIEMVPETLHGIGPGWGSIEELDQFFELLREKGPLPIQEASETFCELTGLTEPEAKIALSDWGPYSASTSAYGNRFRFKMKASTFAWASEVLYEQGISQLDFFSGVIINGPLHELWDADKLGGRAAEIWLKGREKSTPIDVEFAEFYKKSSSDSSLHPLRQILRFKDQNGKGKEVFYNLKTCDGVPPEPVKLLAFAMHNARVGNEVYQIIAPAWEWLRKSLRDPKKLFLVHREWYPDEEKKKGWLALLKGKPKNILIDGDEEAYGSEDFYAFSSSWRMSFWASLEKIEVGHPLLEKLSLEGEHVALQEVKVVFGPDVDVIIERTQNTPVPVGGFESNAILSVPKIVSKVSKKYKISEDAAGLYLQLATLPFPSDANIRTWNGWKKNQHDRAIAELLRKDLIVEAKRARASRKTFVHGFWEPKLWEKPIESWKFKHLGWLDKNGEYGGPLFGGQVLTAPHALFERVWKRIQSGDVPGFEAPPK